MHALLLSLLLTGTAQPCPRMKVQLAIDEHGVSVVSAKESSGSCLKQHRGQGPWSVELVDAKGHVYWSDAVPAATVKHAPPKAGQPAETGLLAHADLLLTLPGTGGHLCLRAPPATLPASFADHAKNEAGQVEVGCVDVRR